MKRALAAALACALTACAYTSSSPFTEYDELPPGSERHSLGLWDLGDNNCRGSIQSAADGSYWVVDCKVRAGFGHCTHGLPLKRFAPSKFSGEGGRVTLAMLDDGSLEESRDGKLVARYKADEGRICGAGK